jgi:V8-like Glu-specific endopeptidase
MAESAAGGGRGTGRPRTSGMGRRVRWLLGMAAALTMTAVGLIAAPLDRGLDTVTAGAQSLDTQGLAFPGTPAVGALFATSGGGLGRHFCSASVVDSPGRDLLVTAAHCVTGLASSIVFVPGFDNGRVPYGSWRVTRIIVGQNWLATADPDEDVAFLVVAGHGGAGIQNLTGGERIGIAQGVGQVVNVIGYPDAANAPIQCANLVHGFSPTQLEFDCGGYTNGTSGGPMLEDVDPATGLGTVIGVIGGYEQGGYTPSVSYAARFGAFVADLYKTATG